MSLVEHVGPIKRLRKISSRQDREVYLLEDGLQRLRVFKVHRNLSSKVVAKHLEVRTRIADGRPSVHLASILAFGSDESSAWEEYSVADDIGGGSCQFEEYSPIQPQPPTPANREQSFALAVEVAFAVCDALVGLSKLGLSHGDVKLTNVLRCQHRWVLVDFDTVSNLTESDMPTASTEGYVPPGGDDGPGRDCYALGKVMYELWTGCSRLEYPTMPPWLMRSKWSREERLLNNTISCLCSPLATRRLRNLHVVTQVLEAVKSRNRALLDKAEHSFPGRHSQPMLPVILAGIALLVFCFWKGGRIEPSRAWAGYPVVFRSFHPHDDVNQGYARRVNNGTREIWMLFNTHATLLRPLSPGDVLDVALKKEIWRGHIGLYISEIPIHSRKSPSFTDRDQFGGIDHILFFHVDGDMLVPPTVFKNGSSQAFSPSGWKVFLSTNTLETYQVRLSVTPHDYLWTVFAGGTRLAEGSYPRPINVLQYLNVYVFDNTACHLMDLKIDRQQ